jgi:DNA-binding XRE family transcriptional regulator
MNYTDETQIINAIIDRIDALRIDCGYSIRKLAKLSAIPEATLKTLLARKYCPKITTIYKLCDAFGISVSQFFLFPNHIVNFSKAELDLLNNLRKLTDEQREAVFNIVNSFITGTK